MNKKPTYGSLTPVEAGPFTRSQRRYDTKRQGWGHTGVQLAPAKFDAPAFVSQTAVAAIRKSFLLAKTSKDAWKTVQREGRFDVRQAPRISRGAQDVFKRKSGASTTKVRVSVLIDASGSMGTRDALIANPEDPTGAKVQVDRRMAAALFGATIATAIGRVPTVTLDVFQHAAGHRGMVIKWRWAKGTPVGVFNEALTGIGGGGNADGHALYAIAERMRQQVKRGERGIIMVVSDGLPSVRGEGSAETTPGTALQDAIAHARGLGFEVFAVAIDGSDQSAYYGEKGVVSFDGNWNALGSALARHIGAALAVR
jgi:Mg-chelatase subunit ChlD